MVKILSYINSKYFTDIFLCWILLLDVLPQLEGAKAFPKTH